MSGEFDPYHKWLAIPPEEQPPNHYRLLALPVYESDPDVIANAADQRMTHVRSFQSGKHSVLTQEILNEIAKAKVCLLSAEKKAGYDQRMRERLGTAIPAIQTTSPPRRSKPKVPPWQVLAGIGAVAVVMVAIAAVLLSGGNPDEVVETASEDTQVQPAPPPPPAAVPETTEEPLQPAAEEPIQPERVTTEVPAVDKPVTAADEQPPVVSPGPKPEPPKPVIFSGDTLAQAAEQFQKDCAGANSSNDFKAAAQKGLHLLDLAAANGNHELAKTIATATLVAARKSEDADLAQEATLRLVGVQKPPTDEMKADARKRLEAAAATAAGSGLPRTLAGLLEGKSPSQQTPDGSSGPDGFQFRYELADFSWSKGKSKVKMIPKEDGFCLLSSVGGNFLGGAEWTRVYVADDGHWYLAGHGNMGVGSKAIAVRVVSPKLFDANVEEYSWGRKSGRVKMIHKNDGFCFLSSVGGGFRGGAESVRVSLDDDGYWYLHGKANQPLSAKAIAVRTVQPGSFRAETLQYKWHRGSPPVKMLHSSEGFCCLSGIYGAFHGGGESVKIYVEADGYWYLGGRSNQFTGAHATGFRFSSAPGSTNMQR